MFYKGLQHPPNWTLFLRNTLTKMKQWFTLFLVICHFITTFAASYNGMIRLFPGTAWFLFSFIWQLTISLIFSGALQITTLANGLGSCFIFYLFYRYVGASSGSKNLILVIDISGSMNEYISLFGFQLHLIDEKQTRLDIIKEATYQVIDTLTNCN